MLLEQLKLAAEQRHALALTRRRRVAHTACAPHQAVGEDGSEPESLLTFCSNDYMGLASHPDVIAALVEGAQRYGAAAGPRTWSAGIRWRTPSWKRNWRAGSPRISRMRARCISAPATWPTWRC